MMKTDYTYTFMTGLIDYLVLLKVRNCNKNKEGKYTVFVQNLAGDASCSGNLKIQGKRFYLFCKVRY